MKYLSESIIDNVIDFLPTEFDSHAFFKKLIRQYPSEYASELCRFKHHADPFFVLHPQLARQLTKNKKIKQNGKVYSVNIGGKNTINESWIKSNSEFQIEIL